MAGFATFGVISIHLVTRHVLTPAAVALLDAKVTVIDPFAAPATGWGNDRFGTRVLVTLPVIAAIVPAPAFTNSVVPAVAGGLAWALYEVCVPALVIVTAAVQAAALVVLLVTMRAIARHGE